MKYHEIGERFEYKGNILEVVEGHGSSETDCVNCALVGNFLCSISLCTSSDRKDWKNVYYKLVEKCNPKDIEQKTEIKVEDTDKTFATQVTNNQNDELIYGSLLDKLFATYKAKNADYGSAFAKMFDELGIDYAYGKLCEKINRIKVLRKQPNMVENEGLEDALLDTAGYAMLTLVELKKRNNSIT